MSVQFNHTIVACSDNRASAEFWAEMLGLEVGPQWAHFIPVVADNGVTFDFANVPPHAPQIHPQHYAFLVSEDVFDAAYAKIVAYEIDHWADPRQQEPGAVNHHDGGRGVYFLDLDGHYLEIITVPYGGWPT